MKVNTFCSLFLFLGVSVIAGADVSRSKVLIQEPNGAIFGEKMTDLTPQMPWKYWENCLDLKVVES